MWFTKWGLRHLKQVARAGESTSAWLYRPEGGCGWGSQTWEFRTRDRSRALVIERGVPGCVWRGCSEPVRAEELVGWEPTPKSTGPDWNLKKKKKCNGRLGCLVKV